ncbi:P-loop containing nucleoside triphosphate hydrolase protein [Choiromyces venosus 120613-1]|uniref:Ribosome assembly protein 1 n=1 Tax=Choiromyces venosus 120613-1 TaxID=1336337 RepID=A0A3N4JAA1_9PEZI|nr:P-loop containing nucleoside triphosphate hydrolase protein [Choiromyces venosus 120613-1]
MPPITPSQIVALQRNSDNIRNICILAHVDHGKTSLSDCLISTNGIISPKLAGRVRYLDSRPDEQLRGITMESSAISLYFRLMRREAEEVEPVPREYLINLIDSPGHIDFSSEVSTASRLCDGAVVLVDAVEGVCSQTVTVLRLTWVEHIRPILVINKIDRLITEIKLSPHEAYVHLSKLLEQVNAVMGSFFAGERMEEDLKWRETLEARLKEAEKSNPPNSESTGKGSNTDTPVSEYEEKDDEDIYFAPEKGNVIFASAIDGWAFTIRQFAGIYEKKLGIKKSILEKVLWGDYYFDPKTKRVLQKKHLKGRNLKPMFVQLVLDNIWAVYTSTVLNKDQEKIEKIVKSLGLKIPSREMKSKDTRSLLSTIFSQWLPLSSALLVSVIETLPSPPAAQKQRIPAIISSAPGSREVSEAVRDAMVGFDKSENAPVMAYVSKMVAVPESQLKKTQRVQLTAEEMRELGRQKRMEMVRAPTVENAESPENQSGANDTGSTNTPQDTTEEGQEGSKKAPEEAEDKEHLIGFARLYSGIIKVGQELYVLGPKYSPSYPDQHIYKFTVTDLYYMMGRDLQVLDEIPAGNVFAIGGLEGKLLKSGTLCSMDRGGVNLAGVGSGAAPIVRVAVEPKNPSQLNKMIEGLKLLEQADPCAEYIVQESGEHVLLTAGELHLERCLKDLRERFAKIDIQSSAPIVPYRETIVSAAEMSPPKDPNHPRGTVQVVTTSKQVSVRIRIRPLPNEVTEFLIENTASIKKLYSERRGSEEVAAAAEKEVLADLEESDGTQKVKVLSLKEFKEGLRKSFEEAGQELWNGVVEKIAAFGPRRIGPNLLIDATGKGLCRKLLHDNALESQRTQTTEDTEAAPDIARGLEDRISHAFQLATSQGPLCHEPIQGIACFVEEAVNSPDDEGLEGAAARSRNYEVIASIQNAIRQGFLDWSPRLLMSMYSCDIQASTEVLGKVYGVITRRRGRIIAEEMKEGTPFYTIKALLPVAESFGFGDDIRKRTSGAASPQLIFTGYEMLIDEDPFWIPFTEDELEDLGELADRENVARKYMDAVRVRKGLPVQKKLVANANKQKTLKR